MDPNSAITIKLFKGDPDGHILEGCYFEETRPGSGEFLFFAPDHSRIETEPSPIPNNTPFTFITVRKLDWNLTFDYSDAKKHGHGSWKSKHGNSIGNFKIAPGEEDPETGTFQAQGATRTGGDDDLSASASASA